MSTRTVCDRCGADCINYVGRFYGDITHTTAQGETVGNDETRRREFCRTCTQLLITEFGFILIPGEPYERGLPESRAEHVGYAEPVNEVGGDPVVATAAHPIFAAHPGTVHPPYDNDEHDLQGQGGPR
jgi:hypothetical protein